MVDLDAPVLLHHRRECVGHISSFGLLLSFGQSRFRCADTLVILKSFLLSPQSLASGDAPEESASFPFSDPLEARQTYEVASIDN